MKEGSVFKRCGCRNPDTGKQYGKTCPQARRKRHGSWTIRQELPADSEEGRRTFTRAGFASREEAQASLDHVRALLRCVRKKRHQNKVTELLSELSKSGDPLPDIEEVRRKVERGTRLGPNPTVGEWLDTWMPMQKHLARATVRNYSGHIDDYLRPYLGEIELDHVNVGDLVDMFAGIEEENERTSANNDDRHAIEARIRAAPTSPRSVRRQLREQLAALPPYRRPAGPSTRNRIKATLRKALNDAIVHGLITFNAAQHIHIRASKPRPMVWTPARVDEWRQTGKKPSPVMVWTPEQAGEFLDSVAGDPLYALWHTAVFRGPRRGELCGLSVPDVAADYSSITVANQLTEVDYEIEESPPKSDAGRRVIALDAETGEALKSHLDRQRRERMKWGEAWVDSGRVFTNERGEHLRPSSVSNRFERLVASADLPPIRFHDLRHVAATLSLAAGVDMKVIQELLGHASLSVTSDLYSSVLPELAIAAAEATASMVP